MIRCLSGLLMSVLLAASALQARHTDFTFDEQPVRDVIHAVEAQTPYRFLFQDALVEDIRLTFRSGRDSVLEMLEHKLLMHGVGMQTDSNRAMVFLYELQEKSENERIRGVVLDAASGQPLPFATLVWENGGDEQGAAAGADGRFSIPSGLIGEAESLTISYLGYSAITLENPAAMYGRTLEIRLHPETVESGDIIITGRNIWPDDAGIAGRTGTQYGAFGGQSTVRELAWLPSVGGIGAAASRRYVRGSKADGFDVQLDGMPVYSHQHLFGLFDAFHSESLRAVGFFPGVAPAYYPGPPGATLSYVSRPPSGSRYSGSAGLSNTMVRAASKGPLGSNGSGWMLSGRYSLLNADVFRNQALLRWGLDAGRPSSRPEDIMVRPGVRPLDEHAVFYDLHAGINLKTAQNGRLGVSIYAGGNEARIHSERLQPAVDGTQPQFRPVETKHNWDTVTGSVNYRHEAGNRWFLEHKAGFSMLQTSFSKDDFLYQRAESTRPGVRGFYRPFENRNELIHFRIGQTADTPVSDAGWLTTGHSLQQFRVDYAEKNAFRPEFERLSMAWQWDAFVHYRYRGSRLTLSSGLRTHYYSNGNFFRLSPRISAGYRLFSNVTASAGYSRNYQFLHSLSLNNYVMSDFWVMSGSGQAPSVQDQFTSGLRFNLHPAHSFHVEGFYKFMHRMRQPKVNARLLISAPDLDAEPWFSNNRLRSGGGEFLYLFEPESGHRFSAAYTLSRTDTRNPLLNRGEWYPVEWDRRHQVNFSGEVKLPAGFSVFGSYEIADGNFNQLSLAERGEPSRNSAYHRVDAGAAWRSGRERVEWEVSLHIYNVLDRSNTLYRATQTGAISRNGRVGMFTSVEDIYDLGIMPSLDISVRF